MKTTLENADRIAKFTLAICVIIFYSLQLIAGPFALTLFILSWVVILGLIVSIAYKWSTMD